MVYSASDEGREQPNLGGTASPYGKEGSESMRECWDHASFAFVATAFGPCFSHGEFMSFLLPSFSFGIGLVSSGTNCNGAVFVHAQPNRIFSSTLYRTRCHSNRSPARDRSPPEERGIIRASSPGILLRGKLYRALLKVPSCRYSFI